MQKPATTEAECNAVINGNLTSSLRPPYPSGALIIRLAQDAKSYHQLLKRLGPSTGVTPETDHDK